MKPRSLRDSESTSVHIAVAQRLRKLEFGTRVFALHYKEVREISKKKSVYKLKKKAKLATTPNLGW